MTTNRLTRKERILKFNILRHNPQDKSSVPQLVSYELKEAFGMTLFIALNDIRETMDNSLQVDFFCSTGYCGSCAMLVNGKPRLACKTLTQHLDTDITLLPLPTFSLIADLSIDLGHWLEGTGKWLDSWLQTHNEYNLDTKTIKETMKPRFIEATDSADGQPGPLQRLEVKMEPEIAEALYKLHSCIDCGCCIAAANESPARREQIERMNTLTKIARFTVSNNGNNDWDYELVSNNSGIFGLTTLETNDATCPQKLPLELQMSHMIRKMIELESH